MQAVLVCFLLLNREPDIELRALIFFAMRFYESLVVADDLHYDREADTRAIEFLFGIQTLEDLEDPLPELIVEPNAVICVNEMMIILLRNSNTVGDLTAFHCFVPERYHRPMPFPGEFQRITEKIDQ